jgi:HTH-type transcriptional regulator/antitoxin HigA
MKYKTLQDINNAKDVISCPGDTLLETIQAKGISQSDLALRMGRPLKTINEIIMGKAAITPETAIQLERVIGPSAQFWLNYEGQYRLDLAEIAESELLLEASDWIAQFPLAEMKKLQWINFENDLISKTDALLKYFSVATKESFRKYYHENLYAAAFRKSPSDNQNSYAIVSWLRRGDIQAEKIQIPPFDSKKFKAALPVIKYIMTNQPDEYFSQLLAVCNECGVKLVFTPGLPKASVNGATRWHNEHPVIQLSDQYKRIDIFWFTFFHEAAHIVLHGKKNVFIEGIEPSEETKAKELQSDEFAAKWVLSETEEKRSLQL